MDRAVRPTRFEVNPNEPNAAKEYTHWIKSFENYCEVLPQTGLDKLKVLTNHLHHKSSIMSPIKRHTIQLLQP